MSSEVRKKKEKKRQLLSAEAKVRNSDFRSDFVRLWKLCV